MYAVTLLVAACISLHASSLAGKDQFFIKADAGYNQAMLPGLSDELERQGSELPVSGYSLNVSLGRTFLDGSWAAELYFSVSLYQEFDYRNDHEDFSGKLSHYDYALIAKKRLLAGEAPLIPFIGAGAGYGVTNLISGGGKIGLFEVFAIAQCEAPLRGNTSLLVECAYCQGLGKDRFDNPFLENVSGDVVQDSDGNPLEDSYGALEFRVGILVWLKASALSQSGTGPGRNRAP